MIGEVSRDQTITLTDPLGIPPLVDRQREYPICPIPTFIERDETQTTPAPEGRSKARRFMAATGSILTAAALLAGCAPASGHELGSETPIAAATRPRVTHPTTPSRAESLTATPPATTSESQQSRFTTFVNYDPYQKLDGKTYSVTAPDGTKITLPDTFGGPNTEYGATPLTFLRSTVAYMAAMFSFKPNSPQWNNLLNHLVSNPANAQHVSDQLEAFRDTLIMVLPKDMQNAPLHVIAFDSMSNIAAANIRGSDGAVMLATTPSTTDPDTLLKFVFVSAGKNDNVNFPKPYTWFACMPGQFGADFDMLTENKTYMKGITNIVGLQLDGTQGCTMRLYTPKNALGQ